jgi:hypothetical protein
MVRCALLVAMLLSGATAFLGQDPSNTPASLSPARRALWQILKKQLTGSSGAEYFQQSVKDSALPPLEGRLVSATPAERPGVLIVAMSDGDEPEVTLRLKDKNGADTHLSGPVTRGSSILFEGIAVSFTREPFMLTFDVSTSPRLPPPGGWPAVQHPKPAADSK